MRLIPNVSREDVEQAAVYIADAWRCHRVRVTQPKPGHLTVRGLVREPLAEPLNASRLPAFDGRQWCWAATSGAPCAVSASPTTRARAGLGTRAAGRPSPRCRWPSSSAPSPLVDFWVMDGGACDWSHFAHGAEGYVDDDLDAAEDMLHTLEIKMRTRRRTIEAEPRRQERVAERADPELPASVAPGRGSPVLSQSGKR